MNWLSIGLSTVSVPVLQGTDMPYSRPEDWLDVTTPESSEEVVYILAAVFNSTSNYVAFTFAGNYHVDWGDGNDENVSSGVTAEHNYTWGDLDSGTLTSRGYRQTIITVTPQAGQNLTEIELCNRHSALNSYDQFGSDNNTSPWLDVRMSMPNCTTMNTFYGGSVSQGSRCRMLEVVKVVDCNGALPTSCFAFLGALSDVEVNLTGVTHLDGVFNTCTLLRNVSLTNSGGLTSANSTFVGCSSLSATPSLDGSSIVDCSSMFSGCTRLENITLTSLPAATTMQSMYSNCKSLAYVPSISALICTNWSAIFAGCNAIESVEELDLSAVLDASNMFANCYLLRTTDYLLNTSGITDASRIFNSCTGLRSVTGIDFSSVTDATGMFENCSALETVNVTFGDATLLTCDGMFEDCVSLDSIGTIDFSSATDVDDLFYGCQNLIELVDLDFSSATAATDVFRQCSSLRYIGDVDLSGASTVANLFDGCVELMSIGDLDIGSATNITEILDGCQALRLIDRLDIESATTTTNAFRICGSLTDIGDFVGPDADFDLSACQMTAESLDIIYTGLPTATRTITVTGNPGTAGDDPSIATAKNWTVTDA